MTGDEFQKVWRLLGSLWPAAAAKKTKTDIAVWKRGLQDYDMTEVSDSIMTYAQGNKFFPDLADITRHLLKQSEAEAAIIQVARLYARVLGMKAPEFASSAEAIEWFHGLEAAAKEGGT